MGQELFADSDAVVRNPELQSGFPIVLCLPGDFKLHVSAGRRKLHGVAENVDECLTQLHVVADVIIVNLCCQAALVLNLLVAALGTEHGVDRFQKSRK